jgi:nucleosome binding factor SPN SPT16 subunit
MITRALDAQAAREADDLWKGADALVIDAGTTNEEEIYSKSASLQTWLLGYEFPETILVVGSRNISVLTSKKKGAVFAGLVASRCQPLDAGYPLSERCDGLPT